MNDIDLTPDNPFMRCMDGIYRSKTKIIGRCWCGIHKGYLTVPLMRRHECLDKRCRFLERFEEQLFWIKRSKKQALRKARKEAIRLAVKQNQRGNI